MAYSLRITLSDGEIICKVPDGVDKSNLSSFDSYLSKKGSNVFLYSDLKKELYVLFLFFLYCIKKIGYNNFS